jgi:hypothetical protein
MIESIALWLAQELLKFLAARLFKGQLQAIMDRWDELNGRPWQSSDGARQAQEMAVVAITGKLATPLQRQVLRLIYDPTKAADKRDLRKPIKAES